MRLCRCGVQVGNDYILAALKPSTLEVLSPKIAPPDPAKIDCADQSLYASLPQDPQVTTVCATACIYYKEKANPTQQSGASQAKLQQLIDGNCGVLAGYVPAYRSTCPFCSL
jgi:hypothetical protein